MSTPSDQIRREPGTILVTVTKPQHRRVLSDARLKSKVLHSLLKSSTLKTVPTTPMYSSLRSTSNSTPTKSPPVSRKVVTFSLPSKTDSQWNKDLITEFNLTIPKKFDYKTSRVRTISELANSRDHITTADFWSFKQKLRFVQQYHLQPLLAKRLERSPAYELRLIARLSQPASPFQMDNRTSRLVQEKKSVKDFKLMNNNQDPWGYSPLKPKVHYYQDGPTIDEWGNHPIYRPTSAAERGTRARLKEHRAGVMNAFMEAIDVTEHKLRQGRQARESV